MCPTATPTCSHFSVCHRLPGKKRLGTVLEDKIRRHRREALLDKKLLGPLLGQGRHMEPAPRCLWEMDILESCTQPLDTGCSVLLYPLDTITRGLTLLQPHQRSVPHKSDKPGLALPGQPAGKWWAGGQSVSEEGYAKETQSKHSEIPYLCLSSLIFTSQVSVNPSLPSLLLFSLPTPR